MPVMRTRARPAGRRSARFGMFALLTASLSLFGCARDVVMLNPRTGETTICTASPLNPWSQQQSCIGGHVAEGWRRQE